MKAKTRLICQINCSSSIGAAVASCVAATCSGHTVDVSENVTLPSALYLKPRYLFKL